MHRRLLLALGIVAVVWAAAPAGAQPAPAAAPATPAAAMDYGMPISNEQAKTVAAAAVAEARRNNWRMAFAVVGPGGELVYFERMDGTQLASAELAQAKARTSVMFRRPSKAFADQFAAGNTTFLTFPAPPIASEGGVYLTLNGKIIGAIGAAGGTGQQDGAAATAGAGALK